jgi:hypothetical protein
MGQYYKAAVLKEDYRSNNPVIESITSWNYGCGAKLMEHSYVGKPFVERAIGLLQDNPGSRFVWAGDYADPANGDTETEDSPNIYTLCEGHDAPASKRSEETRTPKYIINLDKGKFVRIPRRDPGFFRIHPLPLLCAAGNDRGGGDYHNGKNYDKVGSWAYDHITLGYNETDIKGYEEMECEFVELYGDDLKHDIWVCVCVHSPMLETPVKEITKTDSPRIEQAEFSNGYMAWDWYKKHLPSSKSDAFEFVGDESLDTYGKELHQAEWKKRKTNTRLTVTVKRVRI